MIICKRTETRRRKRAQASPLNCRNTFTTRLVIRAYIAAPERLAKGADRKDPENSRVERERRDRRDKVAETAAFEEDRLENRHVVARVDEIGDPLHRTRHLIDREREAGEQ